MRFSITSPLLFTDLFKRLPPEFNSDLFNACVSNAEIEACEEYLALFTSDSSSVSAVVDLLQYPGRTDDAEMTKAALQAFDQIAEGWELEAQDANKSVPELNKHPLIKKLREIGDFELWMRYTKTLLGEVTKEKIAALIREIEQLLRVGCVRELLRDGLCPFTRNYVDTFESWTIGIRNYLDVYCAAAAKDNPRDELLIAYIDYWLDFNGVPNRKRDKQATIDAINAGFTEAFGPKFASDVSGAAALIPIEFQPLRKMRCLDQGEDEGCRKLIKSFFEKITSSDAGDFLYIGHVFISRFVRLMENKTDIHHIRILLRSAKIPDDIVDGLKIFPMDLARLTERYESAYNYEDGGADQKASPVLQREAGLLLHPNLKLFAILAEFRCAVPTDFWIRLSESQSPEAALDIVQDALRLIRRSFVISESFQLVYSRYLGSDDQPPVSHFPAVLSSTGRRLKSFCDGTGHCLKKVVKLLPESTLLELDTILDQRTLREALDFVASNSIAIIEATRLFEEEMNAGVEHVSSIVTRNLRRVRTGGQAFWTRVLRDRSVLLSDDKFQEMVDRAASSSDGQPDEDNNGQRGGSVRNWIVDEVKSLFQEDHLRPQDEESICAIRTEDLFSEECEYLLCSHGFHCQCLDDWWKVRTLCPLCRKKSIRT